VDDIIVTAVKHQEMTVLTSDMSRNTVR